MRLVLIAALLLPLGCAQKKRPSKPASSAVTDSFDQLISVCDLVASEVGKMGGMKVTRRSKPQLCAVNGSTKDLKAEVDPASEIELLLTKRGWSKRSDNPSTKGCFGSYAMRRRTSDCRVSYSCNITDDEEQDEHPTAYELTVTCTNKP